MSRKDRETAYREGYEVGFSDAQDEDSLLIRRIKGEAEALHAEALRLAKLLEQAQLALDEQKERGN